jgi:hypothetical protein
VYDEDMFALGIPIFGGLAGFGAMTICLIFPGLERFAAAALVSPFAASVVFLFGTLIIADMHPGAEYGSAYTPTGRAHDPTTLETWLYLGVSCHDVSRQRPTLR